MCEPDATENRLEMGPLRVRANYASGTAIPIATSVAWGWINNNPFHRDKLDQVGLGFFSDKTNLKAVGQPARGRSGSHQTLRWRRESRANPSLKLVLIPGRLWVIPDRKSDVSCLE